MRGRGVEGWREGLGCEGEMGEGVEGGAGV